MTEEARQSPPDALSRDLAITKALVQIHGVILTISESLDLATKMKLTPLLKESAASLNALVNSLRDTVDSASKPTEGQ